VAVTRIPSPPSVLGTRVEVLAAVGQLAASAHPLRVCRGNYPQVDCRSSPTKGVHVPDAGDDKVGLFYVAVGKNVRAARKRAGMSQATMARWIGFTRSSVANLEAGRQRVALHLFVLIAQALGVGAGELLPESPILMWAEPIAVDNLQEHLVGTPETTQDFVKRAVSQVIPNPLHEES
jgi:transcriptional regulator with XRE-family HTH domain